jgi:type I site-specific restriction endonuclease
MEDEIELNDEYELMPLTPLRKLEKRIEKIEEQAELSRAEYFVKDVLEIIKGNQKVVNDIIESNLALKKTMEDLVIKMDSVIENMNSFMKTLKEASEVAIEEEISSDMNKKIIAPLTEKFETIANKIDEIAMSVKSSNEHLINSLTEIEKRLKRIYASQRKEEFFGPKMTSPAVRQAEIPRPVLGK